MTHLFLNLIPVILGAWASWTWLGVANRMTECRWPIYKRIFVFLFAGCVAIFAASDIVRNFEKEGTVAESIAILLSRVGTRFGLLLIGLYFLRRVRVCRVRPVPGQARENFVTLTRVEDHVAPAIQ